MIDERMKVWLIEVNTNPCLELSSSYLSSLIPAMIDNAFNIALDPIFPPPQSVRLKTWINDTSLKNKFELVSSSDR